ncbi:DNA methyltransferase [Providencia rettgeri]
MQTKLIRELNNVLKTFPQFWNGDELHRSKVVDAIENKNPDVIKALVANEKIKTVYGTNIDDIFIFDFDKLCKLLKYKEYWANCFTKHRNKVGLTSDGKYLDYSSDVVLDFPFKDCVLEGGMTKEEQGKDEIYYNEIIARDEIDCLFSPKILTKTRRYTKEGIEENVTDFSDEDNLIIKGNNLIALHSLKERYAGKVKLIYIDPPYNTGNDGFKYNDRFNHSSWLVFMKNRLEVAKDLLSDDGALFVQCDDNEQAYLKILLDDIFGKNSFVNTIAVKMSTPSGLKMAHKDKTIVKTKEYIHCYSKKNSLMFNPVYIQKDSYDPEYCHFINKNNSDNPKDWTITNIKTELDKIGVKELDINNSAFKKFYTSNSHLIWARGRHHNIPKHIFELSQKNKDTVYAYGEKNNINYAYRGRRLAFLDRTIKKCITKDGSVSYDIANTICDFWEFISTAKLFNEGGVEFPNGKKPELILYVLMEWLTNENDIVLDFHLGSGTTAAVAHKMGRRYIGIEQMDYINDITVPRLKKVIEGEQGGISKDVNWQGGGSFVYTELMELNAYFVHEIQKAQSNEELEKLFAVMKTEAHLNYQVALENVLSAEYEVDGIFRKVAFSELELHEQKRLLIEILDKNQLYVNASEMDDCDLNISESDKAFTRSFYGME